MRILALTAYPPNAAATNGGAKVMGELLTRLSRRHTVVVLALRGAGETAADASLAVEEVARPGGGGPLRQRVARAGSLARGAPPTVREWNVAAYRVRLAEVLRDFHPDLVQAHYDVMGQYLDVGDAPSVLIDYEPGSSRAAEVTAATYGPRRSLTALEERIWRRYEASILRLADAAVVFTVQDAAALRESRSATRIEIIPFGLALAPEPLDATGDGRTVLFVGNFEHAPNVDAARRLAVSIHPLLAAGTPLALVGARPPGDVLALASGEVEVHGSVADVTPFLDGAAVVAIPLRRGGGMRVKTLEALGAGKAVVASPLAVAGLDVVHGQHVLLAETDEEFAAAIQSLLDDVDLRRSLGAAARLWAEANVGWDARIEAHELLYRGLVDKARN